MYLPFYSFFSLSGNHPSIFRACGLTPEAYPYWDPETKGGTITEAYPYWDSETMDCVIVM